MTIRGIDLLGVAKSMYRQVQDDDLMDEAAAVAYHILFAVVPLLVFVTALSGFITNAIGQDDVVTDVTNWLFEQLPAETAAAVQDPIRDVLTQQAGGLLSIGAVLALWSGKNAVAAMMKGLNTAFDVEETRSWPVRNGIAIALTAALGIALIGSSLVLITGLTAWEQVTDWLGISGGWVTALSWLRWPAILVFLMVGIGILYWAGPNVDAPFRWLTPGAVLTVVLWGLSTLGLGLYFRYAGSYVAAYGVLGGVLAFIFWLYLVSLLILLGGELNALLKYQRMGEATGERAAPAGAPATRRQRTVEA
ncbi:MAG: YihY/virulence factor BrkB family protein [Thermomicrobiales bacterium]